MAPCYLFRRTAEFGVNSDGHRPTTDRRLNAMSTTPTDITNSDVHSTGTDSSGAGTHLVEARAGRAAPRRVSHRHLSHYLQDRDETIVTLAYNAGLRAGELVALDVDHADLEAGPVYLPTAIQKGSPPPATLELERDTVRTRTGRGRRVAGGVRMKNCNHEGLRMIRQ